MRQRTLIVTSLALAVSGFGPTSAAGQEEYRHGHIRHVEPGVTLQRATEASAEEAIANLPFLPGDRVWTDAAGRAAFQFPEGTVVRLDRGSKLDYSDHDESGDERVVLRLWSGSLILRARSPESAILPNVLTMAASLVMMTRKPHCSSFWPVLRKRSSPGSTVALEAPPRCSRPSRAPPRRRWGARTPCTST